MAGFGASTEAMQKAAKGLSDLAKDTQDQLKKVGTTETVERDFGEVHKQHFPKYKQGVDNFGKGITNMASALTAFGGQIASGASTYDSVDSSNADNVGSTY